MGFRDRGSGFRVWGLMLRLGLGLWGLGLEFLSTVALGSGLGLRTCRVYLQMLTQECGKGFKGFLPPCLTKVEKA